jgi:hypothetical protein
MNANDLFNAVMQLDLTPVKKKLMHAASGEGWSLEKANAVEKEYRRFLCLMKLFPEEDTAPLVDVDTFWHYHILDTMKYAADCEKVFGYFLHHYPYVGMDGTEEDEQFRLDSGDRMRTLYENIFGEAYPESFDEQVQAAAYCAGPVPPHKLAHGIDVRTIPAPRTGTGERTAYCAGPVPPHVAATKIAYCAGPVPPHVAATKTAYCAGPVPPHVTAAKTAYCAARRPAMA